MVLFSKTNEKNKRVRPKRRWTYDLKDWCKKDTCTLYRTAVDRNKWRQFVKHVVCFSFLFYFQKIINLR